jgi:UTP--glucose-1-phosphate uridylyltransferase
MKVTQAILPVAGFGTRFLPWTKVVPKELLPIGNKPIIGVLVDECLSVGIHDICFVISRGKEAIPQYFYAQPELERELERRNKLHMLEELTKYNQVRFHVAYQEEMKGDGHAILQARDWVESDHVAILFGDDIIAGEKNGLQQLTEAMKDLSTKKDFAMLCLQDVERKLVSKYGIVDIVPDNHKSRTRKIKGLVEKPKPEDAPSTLGIVGKYIVPRSTIEQLNKTESGHHDREIRLIDALKAQLKTIDIFGYEFEGKRYDTGTPEGYREAVVELGMTAK